MCNLSFDKCLMKEAGITIHVKNLHKQMLEVFKTLNYLNHSYLWYLFNVKQVEYNLRIKNLVVLPQIKTQPYRANSITFRGSILWNALTNDIKAGTNVAAFKKKVIGYLPRHSISICTIFSIAFSCAKDNNLSFDKCLMKEAGIKIHVKDLHKLMLEVYKTLNHLNLSYLWGLFIVKQVEYNMRIKHLVI